MADAMDAFPDFNLSIFEDIFEPWDEDTFAELMEGIEGFETTNDINFISETTPELHEPGTAASVPEAAASTSPDQRFPTLDDKSIQGIVEDTNSKATERNTSWGVKIFRQWLGIRNFNKNFEGLPADQLNDRLRVFYAEVRNTDGKLYSKSSYVGLRSAIHRHIRGPPYERAINILQDREFHTANNVFMSMIKKLKREGLDETSHHAAIPETDLTKIRESLDIDTPIGLLHKVWFDLTLGFARRGKENQRELSSSSFRVASDEDGFEFIEMTHSEVTKNHRGDLKDSNEPKKRIYATSNKFCPVASFRKYMSVRNVDNTAFYQAPKAKASIGDTAWYTSRPIGVNTIANLMKVISKTCWLSKVYTNHCLRATAVTLLSHAGVANREICKITGHKTDEFLKSYSVDSSSAQKRQYSGILQGQRHDADQSLISVQRSSPVSTRNPVTNFQVNTSDTHSHGLFHMCNSNITVNNYFQSK